MSRPSARTTIVRGAIRVAARTGLGALTFDAVAEEAGVTKGGVIYHFPTKDDLVRATVQEIIDQWDDDVERYLDEPYASASREDRIVAFILSSATAGTGIDGVGELSALVDVMRDESYVEIWLSLRDKWVGDIATLTRGQQIALAAADGIWVDEAMQQAPYPAGQRDEILAELARMARG
ncbi:TetR/AcrR family transcriptional regulator [Microbacterium indicum]|uniref:TetR/AcrR family transcriptional regulator n=1 Tax=Microbacterium indicum TaxID=358100 RepID=UPI0003F782E4|nr:TetR/AcrR family transcriptional regulator [Microbacterium indicum]